MVSVTARVTALERFRRRGGATDAEIRAHCDAVARAHDLPADEVYAETLRILALPPAALAALAAKLGVDL